MSKCCKRRGANAVKLCKYTKNVKEKLFHAGEILTKSCGYDTINCLIDSGGEQTPPWVCSKHITFSEEMQEGRQKKVSTRPRVSRRHPPERSDGPP